MLFVLLSVGLTLLGHVGGRPHCTSHMSLAKCQKSCSGGSCSKKAKYMRVTSFWCCTEGCFPRKDWCEIKCKKANRKNTSSSPDETCTPAVTNVGAWKCCHGIPVSVELKQEKEPMPGDKPVIMNIEKTLDDGSSAENEPVAMEVKQVGGTESSTSENGTLVVKIEKEVGPSPGNETIVMKVRKQPTEKAARKKSPAKTAPKKAKSKTKAAETPTKAKSGSKKQIQAKKTKKTKEAKKPAPAPKKKAVKKVTKAPTKQSATS